MPNAHYLKYKESINRCRKAWILKQDPDEYKKSSKKIKQTWIDKFEPGEYKQMMRDLVADHYVRNKDKILFRKKKYAIFKKEVNRLFSTYDIYEI